MVLNGNIDGCTISGNAFCDIGDEESWKPEYGKMYQERTEISDGYRSLIDDVGSDFVPDEELLSIGALPVGMKSK